MKFYILFFCCIISVISESFSQSFCQKGTWIVGCNFLNYSPFTYAKSTFKESTSVQTFSPDTTFTNNSSWSNSNNQDGNLSLTLYVGFGYFVTDNLIFGGAVNNFLPSSIFVRYYLGQHKRKFYHLKQNNYSRFAYFVQAGLSATYNTKKEDELPIQGSTTGGVSRSFNYNVGPKAGIGATYLISKRVAVETSVSYSYSIYGNGYDRDINLIPNGNQRIVGETKSTSHSVAFLFGIQTYF